MPVTRFLKQFLVNSEPVRAFAFGKHPGWDDHIDAIGIGNESLAMCQSLLYVHGIGSVIDSGLWEKTEPVKVIPEFRNLLVWQAREGCLIMRIWSSVDGKGRSKYPMITGVQCHGRPVTRVFPLAAGRLEQAENSCREVRSSAEVRAVIGRLQDDFEQDVAAVEPGPVAPPLSGMELPGILPLEEPQGREGWERIAYVLRTQFHEFASGAFSPKRAAEGRRAGHLRLPLGEGGAAIGMTAWLRFLRCQLDAEVPLLGGVMPGKNWCDWVAGEPSPQEWAFLRMNNEGIPLVTEIPFNIPESLRSEIAEKLDSFLGGDSDSVPNLFPNGGRKRSSEGSWWRGLFGG